MVDDVTATMTGGLVAGERLLPVKVDFSFRLVDPLAVQLTFHRSSGSDVVWVMALALFADALKRPGVKAGEGDVIVALENEHTNFRARRVLVTLRSPEGEARIFFSARTLGDFTGRALRVQLSNKATLDALPETLAGEIATYLRELL